MRWIRMPCWTACLLLAALSPAVATPPAAPVNVRVKAIAVNARNQVAILEWEGRDYVVRKGTKVPDAARPVFEVKEITREKVVMFDLKVNRLFPKQIVTDK